LSSSFASKKSPPPVVVVLLVLIIVTVVSEIGGIIGSTFFVVFAGAIVILNGFDSDGSSLEFWPVFSVIIVVESAEVLFVAVVTFVFLGVGFTFYS
jgi:hypothetical protein